MEAPGDPGFNNLFINLAANVLTLTSEAPITGPAPIIFEAPALRWRQGDLFDRIDATGNTYFAGISEVRTPEPAGLAVLGSAPAGVGVMLRRRNRV